jgi:hypothetical protein
MLPLPTMTSSPSDFWRRERGAEPCG